MKVIIGANETAQRGFLSTNRPLLDLRVESTFRKLVAPDSVEVFFAEHVWEHLSYDDGRAGAALCRKYLRPRGVLRIAVPDRLHPNRDYVEWVRPGGTGPGADDHRVFYDFESLTTMLLEAGFSHVVLLEWWDEHGYFHLMPSDPERGVVRRSSANDPRNGVSPLSYTSLIADAIK